MPKTMPDMEALLGASEQMLMDDIGNQAVKKLMYPDENQAFGPNIPWLADIADPMVDYVHKPINQTGIPGMLMPQFIPEALSNIAWGKPTFDPISSTPEEHEWRTSPIGEKLDDAFRVMEGMPVAGKMAAMTGAGIAGLIPLMNRAPKGPAMMPTKLMRAMNGNDSVVMKSFNDANLPTMLQNQADDVIAVGPHDVTKMPSFLQKQAGMAGGWHGSPHKIDKFKMNHIGSGEGAQAYGHGLYFAQKKDVAKSYAPRDFDYEDEVMNLYKGAEARNDTGKMELYERALMHEDADDILDFYTKKNGYDSDMIKKAKEVAHTLDKIDSKSSFMYKVDIPDEHVNNFLDWDAPLSEQPDSVRKPMIKAIQELRPDLAEYHRLSKGMDEAAKSKLRKKLNINIFDALENGGALYEALGDPKTASQKLNALGIKGTKYFDQGSRDIGEGTRNFVVFDEDIIEILNRR